MSVTVYKEKNFQGVFYRLKEGYYSGKELIGCQNQSYHCEDLDNAINSIRIDKNTIVALSSNYSIRADKSRVYIGPLEISDLKDMSDTISSIYIVSFQDYNSSIIPQDTGVTLFSDYNFNGKRSILHQGDYSKSRLASEEVKFNPDNLMSLIIENGVIVILYKEDNFQQSSDAYMIAGPRQINNLDNIGMNVKSIRVLYSQQLTSFNKITNEIDSSFVKSNDSINVKSNDSINVKSNNSINEESNESLKINNFKKVIFILLIIYVTYFIRYYHKQYYFKDKKNQYRKNIENNIENNIEKNILNI
jgi:hypothetical protein